ncbi:MAG: type II secretion system GspH family protein [Holosporales bacterium]|nr:type II secretion system GspH family protein [Holosporales bacterium]
MEGNTEHRTTTYFEFAPKDEYNHVSTELKYQETDYKGMGRDLIEFITIRGGIFMSVKKVLTVIYSWIFIIFKLFKIALVNFRSALHFKLPGFSLIEISIVLLIMGILAGAIFKGKDLIESAQLSSVAADVQMLHIAYLNYVNSYNSLPGNDKNVSTRFGKDGLNGTGSGKTSSGEAKNIFKHLYAAGLIDSENFKMPKIGGAYDMISDDGIVKLRISEGENGFLSSTQVVSLVAKINERLGSKPGLVETDPKEIKSDSKYLIKIRIN